MQERDWNILVNNILDERCILVIGPEMPVVNIDDQVNPIIQHFSNHLAKQIDPKDHITDPDNLVETVELFIKQQDEEALQYDATEFFDKNIDQREIYDDLVDIPFKLIINASPDKSLIKAFDRKNKKVNTDYYNHRSGKRDIAKWDNKQNPMVFYLYGNPDNWDSVVFSEIHLLDFLLSIISQTPALQSNISSEFRHGKTSFVFLGFDFHSWYSRILLYTLLGGKDVQKGRSRRSIALEKVIKDQGAQLDQITVLFNNKLNIIYSSLTPDQFVKELRDKCKIKVEQSNKGKDASHTYTDSLNDAPSIFICHASEDKAKALEIFEHLRAARINSWIDKEGISTADEWERVIEEKIREVDYFLIIQSGALSGKTRGFVNQDINLDLEISKRIRPGHKYIFPVSIDDSERLSLLKKWQTLDLSNMSKMNDLVKDIRRDWERQNKQL